MEKVLCFQLERKAQEAFQISAYFITATLIKLWLGGSSQYHQVTSLLLDFSVLFTVSEA